jgi:hypothetical protein
MKCSACQNKECERKYENRHKCVGEKENITCSCTCQVSLTEEVTTSVLSVAAGIATFAGGIAFTMATGGLGGFAFAGALVAGGVCTGVGSTLVINPIQKQITGDHMTLKDIGQDVALGATIG